MMQPLCSAQLTPDNTLGVENSRITNLDQLKQRIDGGAIRGNSLFHSFLEFNVAENGSVYFSNPANIQNILSRVTGSNASHILGTLGVLGKANLFLINPNGIIFGENATLDVKGSFYATTSNSIQWGEDGFFSAIKSQRSNLLSVNPDTLFFNHAANHQGSIVNQGNLSVKSGQNITLWGNTVVNNGGLIAPGGTVKLLGDRIGLLNNALIDVSHPNNAGNVLIGGDFQGQGSVPNATYTYVDSEAIIRANSTLNGDGGKVIVWANDSTRFYGKIEAQGGLLSGNGGFIEVSGKEFLDFQGQVNTRAPNGDIGTLLLDPTNIEVVEFLSPDTETFNLEDVDEFSDIDIGGDGDTKIDVSAIDFATSDVILQATNNITFNVDINALNPINITAEAGNDIIVNNSIQIPNQGNINLIAGNNISLTNAGAFLFSFGRDILLDAGNIVSINGDVDSRPFSGNSGNVDIKANSLVLSNNARLLTASSGGFVSGDINVETTEDIIIDRFGIISARNIDIQSGNDIFMDGAIQLEENHPGILTINAGNNLNITNQNAFVFTLGNDGFITVGNTLEVANGANIDTSPFFGDSGNLTVNAKSVILSNGGQLRTTPFNGGNGGILTVHALESIELNGANTGIFSTAVSANPNIGAGMININTQDLIIRNEATIDASTNGTGNGGNININATGTVRMSDAGTNIFSGIREGDKGIRQGGDININSNRIEINKGANLDSSSLGTGNSGNINITATETITIDGRGTDIFSRINTPEFAGGDAGSININARHINITNRASLQSSSLTYSDGNAGSITLTAQDNLVINNAQLSSSLLDATGDPNNVAGNIELKVINGSLNITDSFLLTNNRSQGDAGSISLTGDIVNLNNSNLETDSSTSNGNAGDIAITGRLISLNNRSSLQAFTTGQAEAGDININAEENVTINQDSSVQTEVFLPTTQGQAGSINITVDLGDIELRNNSSLRTGTAGLGNAGDIFIESQNLIIDDSGIVSGVDLNGTGGNAGDILITLGDTLTLNNDGQLLADTKGNGDGGRIIVNAPNGVILESDSQISVETTKQGKAGDITVTSDNITIGKDSQLSATATDTSTNLEGGGNIVLKTSELNIAGELGIFAETESNSSAGNLILQTNNSQPNLNIQFTDNGLISAKTTDVGEGGSIRISAPQTVDIRGDGQITVETTGKGNAGNIEVTGQTINFADRLEISASTVGDGDAGNIHLNGNQIHLSNTQINAFSNSRGNPGGILIDNQGDNANKVTLTNNSLISTEIKSQGQATQPSNITLNTQQLNLNNNSEVTASTAGKGDAGSIEVLNAQTINLSSSEISASTSGEGNTGVINLQGNKQINLDNNSEISSSVEENAVGNSQEITLETPNLSLNNSRINGRTSGLGNAGNIDVNNNQTIQLNNSIISTEITSTGEANQTSNITLNTQQLNLNNNSEVTASTAGKGDAGSIEVLNAQTINLSSSEISASTSGEGNTGVINLQGNKQINLDNNSEISSSVEENAVGNSQEITLETPNLSLNNSRINGRTSGLGNAGNIDVNNNQTIQLNNSIISTEITSTGEANQTSNITLNTQQLNLNNNSEITASTAGKGDAGSIEVLNAQTINLSSSEISASTSGEGNTGVINLQGNKQINLDNNSEISSSVEENAVGNSQEITLETPNLSLNNSRINGRTSGLGNAGNIDVNNNQTIQLNNSIISTEITSTGEANQTSNITLNTQQLNLNNNSEITASTAGKGDAGSIEVLNAQTINLSSSEISASTSGEGNTGVINLQGNKQINLDNNSEISSSVEENAVGNSQEITLETPNLSLNNSRINGRTSGLGNAGNIDVNNNQTIQLNNSIISTEITSTGEANQTSNITLNTQQLNLNNNSEITASTAGKGDAGSILINAETVDLDNDSKVVTIVDEQARGNGGNINIKTSGNSITLNNGSQISSLSQGLGDAGSIVVNSSGIIQLKDSEISTSSQETSGGKISISGSVIRFRGDSDLRTNVNSGIGGGGNIFLQANSIILYDDSDIFAFAKDGQGGNIILNTPIFFGEAYQAIRKVRDTRDLDNNNRVDLDASGAISGSIIVPDLTFIRNSLTELPIKILDPDQLIANTCVVPNSQQAGTFIITGSGGLPEKPGNTSSSYYSTGSIQNIPDQEDVTPTNLQIIEPQGVFKLPDGRLILSRKCSPKEL
ncbi:two-partner secretion domain-containing protein [Crocosphaera sp. Alani8]|uniref:two-partner secretion domain-containing protein n=1 Tax=Crocosphaera sp. Alani8 TaxID=3038952 RepID=UPI00313C3F23